MTSYGRPRSFTIGTLGTFASSVPPSSPIRRPADPIQFPPRLMLPPTIRKGESMAGNTSIAHHDERWGKRLLTYKEPGEFDPKLSSSAPTQKSVLETRLLADLAAGSGQTSNFSKLLRVERDTDFELNEIDYDDETYGSGKYVPDASDTQNDFESIDSYSSTSDDEVFVKDTKNNLAKDFIFHFSFNGEVAQPIDPHTNQRRNMSTDFSLLETEINKSASMATSNLSRHIGKRQFPSLYKKQFSVDSKEQIKTLYASNLDNKNRGMSNQIIPESHKNEELTKCNANQDSAELRWENTPRPQTFSTSPILGFALEKVRTDFLPDFGGMEEPPEFTLDVSYS